MSIGSRAQSVGGELGNVVEVTSECRSDRELRALVRGL